MNAELRGVRCVRAPFLLRPSVGMICDVNGRGWRAGVRAGVRMGVRCRHVHCIIVSMGSVSISRSRETVEMRSCPARV